MDQNNTICPIRAFMAKLLQLTNSQNMAVLCRIVLLGTHFNTIKFH